MVRKGSAVRFCLEAPLSKIVAPDESIEVPFDNNMAERALRMIKTKKNVSGGFRSKNLAEDFCNIRSLFGSGKKQGKNLFDIAKQTLEGKIINFQPT